MSNPNFSFFQDIARLSALRMILATSYLILVFLYPGQNSLQTTVLTPGPVKSYDLTMPILADYPVNDGAPIPRTSAQGIVIQDVGSHAIIYSRQPDVSMLPASTTKIMTALVTREYWTNLNTVITVQNEDRAIGQTIELVKGEQLNVTDMLKGLLIHSGNDAALALADNYQGGYTSFVAAMNTKAKTLHLDHTIYKNPSGVEQYGHITTPRDLAILAQVAMSDPIIAEIVSTKFATITDVTGQIAHPLESTNELLGEIPGLLGLKTGWTDNAGECLVSYIERDGRSIVIVVLGSLDRFGDTRSLINWVYDHHRWTNVLQ